MRMFDEERKVAVNNLILYLKKEEAIELLSSLENLLESDDLGSHMHVSEETYQREVTVLLYEENKLGALDERSKKLILDVRIPYK